MPYVFCDCAGSAKVSQVKVSANAPKALIIEPSKELAEQTLNNVTQFKKYVDNPKLRYDSSGMPPTLIDTDWAKPSLAKTACGGNKDTELYLRYSGII